MYFQSSIHEEQSHPLHESLGSQPLQTIYQYWESMETKNLFLPCNDNESVEDALDRCMEELGKAKSRLYSQRHICLALKFQNFVRKTQASQPKVIGHQQGHFAWEGTQKFGIQNEPYARTLLMSFKFFLSKENKKGFNVFSSETFVEEQAGPLEVPSDFCNVCTVGVVNCNSDEKSEGKEEHFCEMS